MPVKAASLFLKRQSVIPFETMIGFFCAYSGLAGIFRWGISNDVFNRVLGHTWATAFNITFTLAGVAMYFGIGWARRDLEAVGLILVAMSLIIRSLVVYYQLGLSPEVFNSYVYASAVVLTCGVRLWSLTHYRILAEPENVAKVVSKHAA